MSDEVIKPFGALKTIESSQIDDNLDKIPASHKYGFVGQGDIGITINQLLGATVLKCTSTSDTDKIATCVRGIPLKGSAEEEAGRVVIVRFKHRNTIESPTFTYEKLSGKIVYYAEDETVKDVGPDCYGDNSTSIMMWDGVYWVLLSGQDGINIQDVDEALSDSSFFATVDNPFNGKIFRKSFSKIWDWIRSKFTNRDAMDTNLYLKYDHDISIGNTAWGREFWIFSNPQNFTEGSFASIGVTNGNCHIDSGDNNAVYLNFYRGNGGVNFGNGNNEIVAKIRADGVIEQTSNGVQTTFGALNPDWVHIYNNQEKPFIFNNGVYAIGRLMPYDGAHDIGGPSERWGTIYGNVIAPNIGASQGIHLGACAITSADSTNGEVVLQGGHLRSGSSAWDYNKWAGLKYNPDTNEIYLGTADGSIFPCNSPVTGYLLNLINNGGIWGSKLVLNGGESRWVDSYNEGLRINRNNDSVWAVVTLGGANGSASGTDDKTWLIGATPPADTTNPNELVINRNGASGGTCASFYKGGSGSIGIKSNIGVTNKVGFHHQTLSYKSTYGDALGYIQIRLNNGWTNDMISFKVRVCEYHSGKMGEYLCYGYNYGDGYWVECKAYTLTSSGTPMRIWYGAGNDGIPTILLKWEGADIGYYPQVDVYDISCGYVAYNEDTSNFSLDVTSGTNWGRQDSSFIIQSKADIASNAGDSDTLDGRHDWGYMMVRQSSNIGSYTSSLDDLADGLCSCGMTNGGGPFGSLWTHYLNIGWNIGEHAWNSQIAICPQDENQPMMYRPYGVGKAWKTVIDSSNIGSQSVNYAGSAGSAGSADGATYANQLQAFVGDDFTSGDHFIKAIREDGWWMRLKTCYKNGGATTNQVRVGYADNGVTSGNSSRGCIQLASDTIIQWGNKAKGSNLSGDGVWDVDITMDTSYTHMDYRVILSVNVSTLTGGPEVTYKKINGISFSVRIYNRNGSTSLVSPSIDWIAIG